MPQGRARGATGSALGVEPAPAIKRRPRYELIMAVVHPLTTRTVALLARTRVQPWQVVVTHSVVGLLAAVLVAVGGRGAWLVAALLLQVKTVLDNADGGLARATGRVTELGRYLDTGLDLIVNLALFCALAAHGPAWLAALGFLILTAVLSSDFNAERLYREAHEAGAASSTAPPAKPSSTTAGEPSSMALRLFRSLYQRLLAPQDRLFTAVDRRLFQRAAGYQHAAATPERKRAWADLFSTAALVNLGLSSQFVMLGICLVLGRPFAYVYLVLLQGVYVVIVQASRVFRFRRAFGSAPNAGGDS